MVRQGETSASAEAARQKKPPGRENETLAAAARYRERDLDTLRGTLETWLAAKTGIRSGLTLADIQRPSGAGMSSETILATACWHQDNRPYSKELVVRFHPTPGFQLFPDPDFKSQFEVLKVLHGKGLVRTPEPLYFEGDETLLGIPFFVMTRLKGRVPVSSPPYNAEGWLFDASPAERRRVWESAMRELCRIAMVPVSNFPFLDRPERGRSGLEQELEYWRRYMDWATDSRTPEAFSRLYEWLGNHIPRENTDGFAWGDARMGNMMFDETFQLVGVMDWEQANIGGPRQDLGWWLFFDYFHSEGRGLKRLDGLGNRDETVQLWEQLTGESAGDLTWYEAFAAFKVALLTARTLCLMDDPNALSVSSNPAFVRARELSGIAAR